MKKSILILSTFIAILGISALGLINWDGCTAQSQEAQLKTAGHFADAPFSRLGSTPEMELFYDLSSRFMLTVTKEELEKVTALSDFRFNHDIVPIATYYSISVTVLDEHLEAAMNENGIGDVLNEQQLKLLRSLSYSMNIRITANYSQMNELTGKLETGYCTPHMTIVPEKQAEYLLGKEALLNYVKDNTKEFSSIVRDGSLRPGMVSFTVTTQGKLANITLDSSSGHAQYDKRVLELVSTMSGTWRSATNSKGEPVEQKLVFFFGTMGC